MAEGLSSRAMSDEILFYTNPQSRGRIAHWMLEEVGRPYRVQLVALDKGEQKAPDYLAVNPMGKLPALVHRGVVVTEAAAICAYLADAFPEAGLAPALADPARGTYLRWMFFGAGCIEPAVIDKALERKPGRTGQLGYGSFEDTMNTAERAIGTGRWILGERFSAADVYVGSQIGWGLMTGAIEPRPAFQEYVGRCRARPAMQRMVAHCERLAAELAARS
jgi:glutathione S-transferase